MAATLTSMDTRATVRGGFIQASIASTDPDELTERLRQLAPGVRIAASSTAGFRTRVRGYRIADTTILTYASDSGRAQFEDGRNYITLTMPLSASILASIGHHKRFVAPGEIHLIASNASGEIETQPGTHVLGLAIDAALVDAHRRAVDGRWDQPLAPLQTIVRPTTPSGRRVAAYLDRIIADLNSGAAGFGVPEIAYGAMDELVRLLIDAACVPGSTRLRMPRESVARRAEEILAASIRRSVSLSDLARDLETSVRTLSRTFHERRGMGPVAFHRRRRLEAVRRDLFYGNSEEVDVTHVAMRYGFIHLGRFSQDYKRAFGEPPSHTLRH
jgi:AraC-like DNA-binding protein